MGTPIIERLRASSTIITAWDNFIAPFYKGGSTGSFGRLWTSIILAACLFRFWVIKLDPPETMITVLLGLLSYVFLTKGVEIVRDRNGSTKITNTSDASATAATAATTATIAAQPAPTGDGPNV